MLVLGKTIVLCSRAWAQASGRVHQLVERYSGKARHSHTLEPSSQPYNVSTIRVHPLPEKITYTPTSPPTPADPAPRLSPAAKAGIITACIIIFILISFLTLEFAYLGRQRHARAVQQAQREVEQGRVELDDKDGREMKEHVVLESRVEIVVESEEEAQGSSVGGSWREGCVEEADGEVGVWGSERRGMSLQRREY
ncbi:hypothetical protein yc1106_08177 [Curvularia clavata]|uniref:Uncharacterized protein n=1 Tax=Curvularia clavata TaxID=95742 RepID=A0A9Q9DUE1_CURCL|nr:hypothetical protein yc1106_08177 [Curvularia clavata]